MDNQGVSRDAAFGDRVHHIAALGAIGIEILLAEALPEVVASVFASRLLRLGR
jgi:hypothetical protein